MSAVTSMASKKPDTTPRAARKRPLLNLSLNPAAIDRLDEMAERSGESRSRIVERLIYEAPMPRAKT